MDLSHLISLPVVVIYGILLGLITPYVIGKSDKHGALVPGAMAVTVGSLLWLVFTWTGLSHSGAAIWLLVMLLTPAVTFVGIRYLRNRRSQEDEQQLKTL
jgi:hypothetical protein